MSNDIFLLTKLKDLFINDPNALAHLNEPHVIAAIATAASGMSRCAENPYDEEIILNEVLSLYNKLEDEQVKRLVGMGPQYVKKAIGFATDFNDYSAATATYNAQKDEYDQLYEGLAVRNLEKGSETVQKNDVLHRRLTVNKKIVMIALLALMVSIIAPVGYAWFTSNVSGNSTAGVNAINTPSGLSLVLTDGPEVSGTNWVPGNSLEKTFTVKNNSANSLKYYVVLADLINNFTDKNDLEYKLESSDGGYNMTSSSKMISRSGAISESVTIGSQVTHTYKLTITFKYLDEDQSDNMNKRFAGKVNIVDENELATLYPTTPVYFSTSSWDDIVDAYNTGNTEQLNADMLAGTTRDVDLGELGVHQVRIANLTKCSEVNVTSKTACGLVIEFADIITTHLMNPKIPGTTVDNGNKGGWESSDMRAYVNSGVYANENIDYSSSGVYDKIPSELRNLIIDTTVVSGHGSNDSANFTTTDKLYLLSTIEVWNGFNDYDSASGEEITRQLDYYERIGVTISDYSGAIKKRTITDYWWLRSARSDSYLNYYRVHSQGYSTYNSASANSGVSPAFRLAN